MPAVGIWFDRNLDQRAFDAVPVIEDTTSQGYKDIPWRGPKIGVYHPEYRSSHSLEANKVKLYWLATRLLNDDTLNITTGLSTFSATDVVRAEEKVKNATEAEKKELCVAESRVMDGWLLLRCLVTRLFDTTSEATQTQTTVPKLLVGLKEVLNTISKVVVPIEACESQLPGWEGLHTVYAAYEFFKAGYTFCKSRRVAGAPRINKNEITGLANVVRQNWQSVANSVKKWADSIRNNGQTGLFDQAVDGRTGRLLKKFMGEDEIKKAINRYYVSSAEALDGALELNRSQS